MAPVKLHNLINLFFFLCLSSITILFLWKYTMLLWPIKILLSMLFLYLCLALQEYYLCKPVGWVIEKVWNQFASNNNLVNDQVSIPVKKNRKKNSKTN